MLKKTLLEERKPVKFKILEEATTKNGGRVKIKADRLSVADEINGNGRVYPTAVWVREINKLQPAIAEHRLIGAADHPADGQSRVSDAAILWTKIVMEGNVTRGEGVILSTQKGKDLEALIRSGVTIDVSSRGWGNVVREQWHGKMAEVVQDDLQLLSFDAVLGGGVAGASLALAEQKKLGTEPRLSYERLQTMIQEAMTFDPLSRQDQPGTIEAHLSAVRKAVREHEQFRQDEYGTEVLATYDTEAIVYSYSAKAYSLVTYTLSEDRTSATISAVKPLLPQFVVQEHQDDLRLVVRRLTERMEHRQYCPALVAVVQDLVRYGVDLAPVKPQQHHSQQKLTLREVHQRQLAGLAPAGEELSAILEELRTAPARDLNTQRAELRVMALQKYYAGLLSLAEYVGVLDFADGKPLTADLAPQTVTLEEARSRARMLFLAGKISGDEFGRMLEALAEEPTPEQQQKLNEEQAKRQAYQRYQAGLITKTQLCTELDEAEGKAPGSYVLTEERKPAKPAAVSDEQFLMQRRAGLLHP